jgi:hypothetical protein
VSARRRGQATVELAIFSVVFVTILLFGLHFAEIGYLSIKVEEAANSALWDATAKKMHDTYKPANVRWTHYRQAIAEAGPEATFRYQDFDGRASQQNGFHTDGSRTVAITQVFTHSAPIEVTCERVSKEKAITLFRAIRPLEAPIPDDETGMRCTAKALMEGYRLPQLFLENDQSGFFDKQHWVPRDIPICAAGRAKNGECQGGYPIVLDDWGFSGPEERKECPLAHEGGNGCENQGYWDVVHEGYDSQVQVLMGGPRRDASTLAQYTVQRPSPIDENQFYLSFRGSESKVAPFQDTNGVSHQKPEWETTPWTIKPEYSKSPRDDCWLGQKCD